MFSEVLRIKPVLDTATTKQMEQSLSSRFARVAQRFGQGLKAVVKGSIIGISLGLLSKLLNPIEALEDKIKKLMGEGTDIRDLAERFGSSSGEVRQLQDVAQTLGVTPDQFKDMLMKYAEAIEKGREELSNPFVAPSPSTVAVKEFIGEKNIVKSFTDFISGLKAVGQGPGDRVQLAPGQFRQRTGAEARQAVEKEVFGQAQFGGAKRLIDANIPDIAKSINEPNVQKLTEAFNKTASLADQKRALDVQADTSDFLNAAAKLNEKMITDMAASERLQAERDTKQLASYDDLRKAANGIEELKGGFIELSNYAAKGIGYLGELTQFVSGLKNSRVFNLFNGGRKE